MNKWKEEMRRAFENLENNRNFPPITSKGWKMKRGPRIKAYYITSNGTKIPIKWAWGEMFNVDQTIVSLDQIEKPFFGNVLGFETGRLP